MLESKFTKLADNVIINDFNKNRKFKKPIIQACWTSITLNYLTKKPVSGKQILNRYYKIRKRYE